jgi:PhzF family phenazine biosynthesis protein
MTLSITQYQIDAFTSVLFGGNPAAICPLESWLPDTTLQAIAAENNLSETAFFVSSGKRFHLRWFTPTTEVDMCGHATLATAHLLFNILNHPDKTICFETKSGDLTVEKEGEWIVMNFPAQSPHRVEMPTLLVDGLGCYPLELLAGSDYMAVFSSEEDVEAIRPDVTLLERLDRRGVIVTAPGKTSDFVSRFFAPKLGISEDPVTGSAHCELAPYWSLRLNKKRLFASQLSKRKGALYCEVRGNRVFLSGQAVLFMKGTITVGRASG